MLELRVLTGNHAGARVILPDTPQQLGSGADCDLILSDAGLQGRHAVIEARDDGTVLVRWLSSPPQEVVLQPGEAADLGPVRVAIEEADSPWRDDLPLRGPEARSPAGDVGDAEAGDSRIAPELRDDDGAREGDPDLDPDPARQSNRAHRQAKAGKSAQGLRGLARIPSMLAALLTRSSPLAVWTLAGLGLVGAGAALALYRFSNGEAAHATAPATASSGQAPSNASTPSAEGPPPPPPPSPQAQAMALVASVVEPLGLGTRVRIEIDRFQAPRVRAAFLTEPQAHALREALARLPSPPRLEILSASQVQAVLDEALLTQEAAPGSKLAATALGEGRFRIEGRVARADQREALMAYLARAVPLAQGFDGALGTEEDAALALLQAMKELNLAEVDGTWTGSRLEARVRIAPALLPQWERALAAVAARHSVPFRVTLTPTGPPVATQMPFALRSVVGGAMPFVTLSDGRRLAVEGEASGWRLLAIRPNAVVFENEQGARVTLER